VRVLLNKIYRWVPLVRRTDAFYLWPCQFTVRIIGLVNFWLSDDTTQVHKLWITVSQDWASMSMGGRSLCRASLVFRVRVGQAWTGHCAIVHMAQVPPPSQQTLASPSKNINFKLLSELPYYYYYNRFMALWILSRTTGWAGTRKVKPIWARDSEWQWHQLGHMQICTSSQTHNHTSIPPLSFCRPDALPATQRVKALKEYIVNYPNLLQNFDSIRFICHMTFPFSTVNVNQGHRHGVGAGRAIAHPGNFSLGLNTSWQ